jgi:putative oxidoreductase
MTSLGLLVLRLVVGALYLVHGYTKVFGGPGKSEAVSPEAEKLLGKGFKQLLDYGGVNNVTGFVQSLGLPYPRPMAIALMTAEFGGGLALILGWHTRLAALALTAVQGVAIAKVHAPNGLLSPAPEVGFETNVALAAATTALAVAGPGKIAID